MRKLLAPVVCLSLLAGCQTAQPPDLGTAIGTIGGNVLQDFAPEVAAIVADKCGFVITAVQITGIISAYPTIESAALAICQSLNRVSVVTRSSSGTFVVNVHGARVQGYKL